MSTRAHIAFAAVIFLLVPRPALAQEDVTAACSAIGDAVVANADDCDGMAVALADTVTTHEATLSRMKVADDGAAATCVAHMEKAIDGLIACAAHPGVKTALQSLEHKTSAPVESTGERAQSELRRLANHAATAAQRDEGPGHFPRASAAICTDVEPSDAVWNALHVAPSDANTLCYKTANDGASFAAWSATEDAAFCIVGAMESGKPVVGSVQQTSSAQQCTP